MKEKVKFVLKFAAPHKWKFVTMQLCMILTTASLVVLPRIIGWLIDEVFYSQNMSRFLFIVGIYGIVYIFNQAMFTVQNIMEKVLSTAFLFDIRAELYSRILNFKGRYLTNLYSGDMISRMGYDIDQIMDMIDMNLFGIVSSVLNLFMALAFIFFANKWLGIFTVFVTPVIIYISRFFYGKAKAKNYEIIKKKGLLSSWTFEILGGNAGNKAFARLKADHIRVPPAKCQNSQVEYQFKQSGDIGGADQYGNIAAGPDDFIYNGGLLSR